MTASVYGRIWIRSQDKKTLVSVDGLEVVKLARQNGKKGEPREDSILIRGYHNEENILTLARYTNEERAISVLNEIQARIEGGLVSLYEMPKDEKI